NLVQSENAEVVKTVKAQIKDDPGLRCLTNLSVAVDEEDNEDQDDNETNERIQHLCVLLLSNVFAGQLQSNAIIPMLPFLRRFYSNLGQKRIKKQEIGKKGQIKKQELPPDDGDEIRRMTQSLLALDPQLDDNLDDFDYKSPPSSSSQQQKQQNQSSLSSTSIQRELQLDDDELGDEDKQVRQSTLQALEEYKEAEEEVRKALERARVATEQKIGGAGKQVAKASAKTKTKVKMTEEEEFQEWMRQNDDRKH
ncbi:MAG: hypothetical protein EZS28_040983, partial [Streblomastix strix]